jgi:aspartyl-tRNA(Asn)/glutamyl-tRNA(Gln) amidotransferase subunit A
MISEETLYMSVAELGPQIKEKKIGPVELTRAYIDRLEKHGPKLGAIATLMAEQAMAEAQKAEVEISKGDYRGPLHGIPYGAKDLLAAKGAPTTWGAPPFKDQVFDYDATVIRKLREAGAILIAKLAMIELAGGGGYRNANASLQGPSRCPYAPDFWAGGSSSGPGASVPPALVAFAIGSETQGSIITPCAFSGVSGHRPTYGRVSRWGAMALSWTMDKLGPMCRSAVDCALVLEAIAGYDAADESSLTGSEFRTRGSFVGRALRSPGRLFRRGGDKPSLKGMKLGVVRPDFGRGGNEEVKAAFEAALETLRSLGAALVDAEMPDLPYGPVSSATISCEGATIFRPLIESGKVQELVDENQKIGLISSLAIPAADYLDACRVRAKIQVEVGKMFEVFDALVSPSRTSLASPVDRDFGGPPAPRPGAEARPEPSEEERRAAASRGNKSNVIGSSNLCGLPATSVPCGFAKDNRPIGVQFVADTMRDDVCLDIAAAFQAVTEFHAKRPTLA